MNKNKVLLTVEGLKELQKEYDRLVNTQRPEVVAEIKRSRELGDLSENGSYAAAREKQSFIEGRIRELEEILKNVEIIKRDSGSKIITPGSIVTLDSGKETVQYTIVGESEINAEMKKISHESPLGQALIGKKKGDTVSVNAPAGKVEYKIIKIK